MLESAEIAMSPDAYRAGFRILDRGGVFYTTRPDWDRYGVQASATSPTGAEHNIAAALAAHIDRAKRHRLIWC